MQEVTLSEAWRLWFSGILSSDILLWGVSLLWWGRIGKLLQIIGAITVVADIIGTERLRVFGNSLHGRITLSSATDVLVDNVRYLILFLKLLFSPEDQPSKGFDDILRRKTTCVVNCMTLILVMACLYVFRDTYKWNSMGSIVESLLIITSIISGGFIVGSIVLTLLIMTSVIVGLIIDILFIEPLAWLLERPGLDQLTKLTGLLLAIIGFHFDLLAS